jgi:hypothetical protein
MNEKTSHQFAEELLALPDLPIYHLDPSFCFAGEGDNALTAPQVNKMDVLVAKYLNSEMAYTKYIVIAGTQSNGIEDFGGLIHGDVEIDQ